MEKLAAYASNEKVMARDDTAKTVEPSARCYTKLITNSRTFSNTKIFSCKRHLVILGRNNNLTFEITSTVLILISGEGVRKFFSQAILINFLKCLALNLILSSEENLSKLFYVKVIGSLKTETRFQNIYKNCSG